MEKIQLEHSGMIAIGKNIGQSDYTKILPYKSDKTLMVTDFLKLYPNARYMVTSEEGDNGFIYVTDLMMDENYWVYRQDGLVYSPVTETWVKNFFEDENMLASYHILL